MTESTRLDDRLDAELAALSRDVPPGRDLWPDIEARIVPAPADRHTASDPWWRSGWGQLAAAVVLVAVTAIVTYQLTRPAAAPDDAQVAQAIGLDFPIVSTPPATPASFGQGPVLGAEYVEARAALARTFEERLVNLPPATRSKVERNLADIRRASAELAAALDEHPANPLLQDLLVSTYQEELALFAQINQVTAPTMMRNDL